MGFANQVGIDCIKVMYITPKVPGGLERVPALSI
jgi:hypothetical protein